MPWTVFADGAALNAQERPDARSGRNLRATRIGVLGRTDPDGAPLAGRAGRLRPARGLLYPHAEIAGILAITESASQQHVHRARRRVTAERRGGDEVDPASARRIVEEFLTAATSGRTERLVALLTDDATAVSDGYGPARRLLRYNTRERIASYVRACF